MFAEPALLPAHASAPDPAPQPAAQPRIDGAATTALRVGLIGVGTVGTGVWQLLARNQALLAARAGRGIVMTAVATRSPARAAPLLAAMPGVRLLSDPLALAADPGVDVVLELAGGADAPLPWLLAAYAHGKHVVTANKALLARHGAQLAAAAARSGRVLAYEAAVAGAVPVIKTLREALAANRIDALAGILNGTSNFILTRMAAHGSSYAAALVEAQALGYAEADPTLDVNGQDAAHKLALLAANAFGAPLREGAVHAEGIAQLQPGDLAAAAHLGYAVRLLALARRVPSLQGGQGLELRVHPALLPLSHPLTRVEGAGNGLLVHADAAGPLLLCGAGAGATPTASAVLADLVDLARGAGAAQAVPTFGVPAEGAAALAPVSLDQACGRHLLRVLPGRALCEAGAVRLLARAGVAVRRRAWLCPDAPGQGPQLLLLTAAAPDGVARAAARQLQEATGAQVRHLRVHAEDEEKEGEGA
ncbi:MAG TPA: homoserine dehydrogenase [Comamonadaceae bacterium]|uniref:homoserine dehydrogenase n=1 Tax=Pulveribacter sp. TaxID=2678893 RepID=UPI000EDB0EC2|nr:homoserine dehydrogenase [Pulveribacter sp.]HCL85493.1 homoserine dehydrogenase [Comamonadaceae bacterium]